MYKVTLTQIIEKMELKNLLPDIDTDSRLQNGQEMPRRLLRHFRPFYIKLL